MQIHRAADSEVFCLIDEHGLFTFSTLNYRKEEHHEFSRERHSRPGARSVG
jgi:hypothetical protein